MYSLINKLCTTDFACKFRGKIGLRRWVHMSSFFVLLLHKPAIYSIYLICHPALRRQMRMFCAMIFFRKPFFQRKYSWRNDALDYKYNVHQMYLEFKSCFTINVLKSSMFQLINHHERFINSDIDLDFDMLQWCGWMWYDRILYQFEWKFTALWTKTA